MAKVEVLLVGVLIVLAFLLGTLMGGTGIWFLKPEGSSGTNQVQTTINKFVCMDGSVKNVQSECPTTIATAGGETITCPVCKTEASSSSPYKSCSCQQCAVQCGSLLPIITTTTLAPCKPCSANSDCGSSSYSQPKCKNDNTFKMFSEPFCETIEDGRKCCAVKETQSGMTPCASSERCRAGQGCVPYQDAVAED